MKMTSQLRVFFVAILIRSSGVRPGFGKKRRFAESRGQSVGSSAETVE
jgi:hypothetical protein